MTAPVSRSTACSACVGQAGAAVLHLRDLRVRVLRMGPVVVRPLLRALPVQAGPARHASAWECRMRLSVPAETSRSSPPESRPTILRNAAFASSVVASMPTVVPRTRPASASRCSTHVKTASCVSRSIRRRVRDTVEWSGGQGVPTVEEAAAVVLEQQRPGWAKFQARAGLAAQSARLCLFPRIGALPVSEVTDGRRTGNPHPRTSGTTKPETARRVRQRIGAVMKWAVAMGHRPDNPAGDAPRAGPRTAAGRRPAHTQL